MKRFTLIELMFVVMILVILIGIGFVAGTKVLRKQAESKTRAEITMITSAVNQYKDRFGSLPKDSNYNGNLDFPQFLSKVLPDSGWTGKRPMFIGYRKNSMIIGQMVAGSVGKQHLVKSVDNTSPPNNLVIGDPYELPYQYKQTDGQFEIFSVGLDGTKGTKDDVYLTPR